MTAYRVALSVIARDEAPRIGRLLASVAPWVDTMLVLDTGSRDDTVAIARRHGARVEHFPWCDDFAAARNAALEFAAADWHLVLDADEWLIDGGEVLHGLRDTPPDFVGGLRILDRADAQTTSHLWLSRLLPGAVRYAGRIHEQPQHAMPVRRLTLHVGHDGYSAQRLDAKRGRNRRLLQADLAEHPDDAYLWYQLGKDCAVYGEHAAAADALQRAETLCHGHPAWRHDLATRLLFSLKKTGRHAQALDYAQARLDVHAASPDFHFALGDLLLDWAAENPSLADELLPMAQQAWQHCLAIGEQPGLSGAVQGRGSWLAAHNLAVVLEGLGHAGEAAALRKRHPAPA
ncbi:MAG: glycosyltransferase family 2 protein [Rubrivivax sp.]|nr:glycosyltransferase family 2 protein [Rubrivivax sp.]